MNLASTQTIQNSGKANSQRNMFWLLLSSGIWNKTQLSSKWDVSTNEMYKLSNKRCELRHISLETIVAIFTNPYFISFTLPEVVENKLNRKKF